MSLSEGVIELINKAETVMNLPREPVVQIMSMKQIPGAVMKLRASISDGKHFLSNFIMTCAVCELHQKGLLYPLVIVKLIKYTISIMNSRKFYIIVELVILPPEMQVHVPVGSPVNIDPGKITQSDKENLDLPQKPKIISSLKENKPQIEKYSDQKHLQTYGKRTSSATPQFTDSIILPIKALTPYQNKWTIRARVTGKTGIKTYKNSRGEGKLFTLTFVDETGEIRATAFNEAVDAFYETLQLEKIYFISGGMLKVANKQYSSVQNEYEMTIKSDTVIKPCFEEINLPSRQYNFVEISKILQRQKDSVIDVIGVVLEASDITVLNMKATSRQLCKRDLTIGDFSANSIIVTLWGEFADSEIYAELGSVLALKATKVSDFHGRALTTVSSTSIEKNPDIPLAKKLSEWYSRVSEEVKFTPISASVAQGGEGKFDSSIKFLYQISSVQNLASEKGEFIQVVAMLENLRSENVIYKACPTPNCNKKVIEDGPNNYRCEKCNRVFSNYMPRLLCNGKIVDATSFQWVTFFNEIVEKMTDSNAQEIDSASQNDRTIFEEILNRPKFKRFLFKLKLKLDTFNDETRIRCTCIDARPINFVSDGRVLLEQIRQLSA